MSASTPASSASDSTHPAGAPVLAAHASAAALDYKDAPHGHVEEDLVRHKPLIICGPSGVGKGTLLGLLVKHYPLLFAKSLSHTTRAPRAGEADGVSYHFTTPEVLLADVAAGKFIEHANVHGNFYGQSVAAVEAVMSLGKICLLEIDIQGVMAVRKIASLHPRGIFILPPCFDSLIRRLKARGSENDDSLQKRLKTAHAEMDFFAAHPEVFDASLTNDDFLKTYERLLEIIRELYPQLELPPPPPFTEEEKEKYGKLHDS